MLKQRILTVLIAAPFLLGAIFYQQPWLFQIVASLCLLAAYQEFLTIIQAPKSFRLWALLLSAVYFLFAYKPELFLLAELHQPLAYVFILFSLYYCLKPNENLSVNFRSLGLSFFGFIGIIYFGSFIGLMKSYTNGVYWVFLTLTMTWMNDTAAYFAGRAFGRRKLSPLVSPNKSIEGFFGGIVGSAAAFMAMQYSLKVPPLTWEGGVVLTLLVGIIAPLGDLTESMLKRAFDVKDSGKIVPGHGGMLDRIDALLFVAPVIHFFALAVHRLF